MRETSLPSPGIVSTNGHQLRKEACKAISAAEIQAKYTSGGKTRQAAQLSAFFTACVAALSTLVDTVAETVSTLIRTSSTVATITFTGALSPSTSVPLASFTIGARVLSSVVVTGSTIVITGVAITVADVVTYTPPTGANEHLGVRDAAGNLVATFTGALA